jgi:hypothetical protein
MNAHRLKRLWGSINVSENLIISTHASPCDGGSLLGRALNVVAVWGFTGAYAARLVGRCRLTPS